MDALYISDKISDSIFKQREKELEEQEVEEQEQEVEEQELKQEKNIEEYQYLNLL